MRNIVGWAQNDMIMQEQRCTLSTGIHLHFCSDNLISATYTLSFVRSYEAKVSYLKVESEKTNVGANARRIKAFWGLSKKPERVACRAKCDICNSAVPKTEMPDPYQESNWVRVKGRFLSIGAAVISCRNERAPDGLVADAHLSDGFLNLVLIKDCSHAFYLW